MNEDTVFFYRPNTVSHNCLKVYNAVGDELSLSGDDSCGALTHLSRTSLATFPGGGHIMKDEETFVTPEQLLKRLAQHLGYEVTKKA